MTIRADVRAESRNREIRVPPVSVYRWWARRTLAVNGAILDALALDHPGRFTVSDPFVGGGIIPLAAVARGHRVYAQDLNPWAVLGMEAMLALPEPDELFQAADLLEAALRVTLDRAYQTTLSTGEVGAVAHTFRVAVASCLDCSEKLPLYPHAMVSLRQRKETGNPAAYLACRYGHLFMGNSDEVSECPTCESKTDPRDDYTTGRIVTCPHCGDRRSLEEHASATDWAWSPVLVERAGRSGREIAAPTKREVLQAEGDWKPSHELSVIPAGRETAVLRRHGFEHWHDLYPRRQRVVVEEMLRAAQSIDAADEVGVALRLAILGTTEMAGLLSRWDRWYLKSYESMAAHRFNFTTFTAEPNVWGAQYSGRGTLRRRLATFARASEWFRDQVGALTVVRRNATDRRTRWPAEVDVVVAEGSSERMLLQASVVDVVLTDPPYHDDVQYGQLSLPLRAWAGLSTESLSSEAVVSNGVTSGYADYSALLRKIFQEARRTLKRDGHLIFSYANRDPEAWTAVAKALADGGFRLCGYAVVHSENETDHAKRNVRACTMDLLIDVVRDDATVELWRPEAPGCDPESGFLALVGAMLCDSLDPGAEQAAVFQQFRADAYAHPFLAPR